MSGTAKKILWTYVGIPPTVAAAVLPFSWHVSLFIILAWSILGLPFGILMAIDWYEQSKSTAAPAVIARILLSVFLMVFGLISTLMGLGMAGWAFYRPDVIYVDLPFACVLTLALLIFGTYLMKIGWSRKYVTSKTTQPGEANENLCSKPLRSRF